MRKVTVTIKTIACVAILVVISSCKQEVNIYLGHGYKLINSASFGDLSIVDETNIVKIEGHILTYGVDSNFIIASQLPRDSVLECSGKAKGMTLKQCEEAFANSTFRQFWIIDKRQKSEFDKTTRTYSNIFGPFKKEAYLKKREEVGVPSTLRLTNE